MKFAVAILLIAAVSLAGCIWEDHKVCCANPWRSVDFATIDQGPESGIKERRMVTIRDQAEWSSLWREHQEGRAVDPNEAPPSVDFGSRMVVAVFRGQSPDGCHAAEIVEISHYEEGRKATVHGSWLVMTGGACTSQITHPFHIVELEALDAEVKFEMRDTTRPIE